MGKYFDFVTIGYDNEKYIDCFIARYTHSQVNYDLYDILEGNGERRIRGKNTECTQPIKVNHHILCKL